MPINRLSDSRLVRRSQQGDRDAFLVLLERYDHRLRGLAYALVTGEATMERVLRTSYLRAWREVVRADADDDAGTWLYRLTYNACIDELRRERARLDRPDDPAHAGPAADPDVDDPLVQALAALPPEHRLAVVLVDREGFTPQGASRIAGIDQALFDERLVAGRAALAAALPTAAPRRRNTPARRRPPNRPPRPSASPSGPPAPAVPAGQPAPPAPAVSAGPSASTAPGAAAGPPAPAAPAAPAEVPRSPIDGTPAAEPAVAPASAEPAGPPAPAAPPTEAGGAAGEGTTTRAGSGAAGGAPG